MNLPSEYVRRKLKITMREKLRHHFSSIAHTIVVIAVVVVIILVVVVVVVIIIIIYLVIELYFHGMLTLRYVRMTAIRFLGKVICLVLKLATHTEHSVHWVRSGRV
jgi:uncharacterized BrkB/YihY/UPF0761 family membrane protein